MASRAGQPDQLIHRAIHGYRHGHELLGASSEFDDETANSLSRNSDSAPNARVSDGSYLSGYPLTNGHYVVARTWHVTDAERPNTVLTHSLILPPRVPPSFTAFSIIEALHAPPLLEQNETLEPIDASFARGGGSLVLTRAEATMAARYYTPPHWLSFDSPAGRDRIALGIWQQLWRSARFRLRFCTAPDADRFGRDDWSIRFESTQDAMKAPRERKSSTELIIDDLVSPGEFREFLHFVGSGERATGLVEPFADAYFILNKDQAEVEVLTTFLIRYRGTEPRRLRRLKRRFLSFQDEIPRWEVQPLDLLRELTGWPLGVAVYASDASLERWVSRCWDLDPERTIALLMQADSVESISSVGPLTAADGLANAFAGQASDLISPSTLPIAVSFNRGAAMAAVWDRNEPDLWRAWAALDSPSRAGGAVDGDSQYDWTTALEALRPDTRAISRLLHHHPEALDGLIAIVNETPAVNDGELELTTDAQRYLRDRLEVSETELAGLARLSNPATLPKRLQVDAWNRLVELTEDDCVLATGYLIARLASTDHWEIATLTMVGLYKRLATVEAQDAWIRVEPHLRGDRGTWDRCGRLSADFATVVRKYDDSTKLRAVALTGKTSTAAANALEAALRLPKSKKLRLVDPSTWI